VSMSRRVIGTVPTAAGALGALTGIEPEFRDAEDPEPAGQIVQEGRPPRPMSSAPGTARRSTSSTVRASSPRSSSARPGGGVRA
jgi:hypothetical protein